MSGRIISGILTLLLVLAAALVVLFMMLIAMNGYSESDATPGLVTYIVIAVGSAIATSTAAFFISGIFIRRGSTPAVAALIATPLASVIGVIITVVACFMGIGVAEYVRVNY